MNRNARGTICLGMLGVALVAALDAALGYEVNLIALQLAPVLLVTWYASPRWGVFLLVLMTLIALLMRFYVAPPAVHPLYRYLGIAGNFAVLAVLIAVQARLRAAYRDARRRSRVDALTGNLSRSGFHEQLRAEVARQKRYGRSFSLLYLDVDDFKRVNDTHGHQAADALLAEIGRSLHARLRRTDSAGRLGGDEFAVLLRETDLQAAEQIAMQLKQELERTACGHRWPVGFSIGAVCFSRPPQDADEALRVADALMAEAKKGGKNALRSKIV